MTEAGRGQTIFTQQQEKLTEEEYNFEKALAEVREGVTGTTEAAWVWNDALHTMVPAVQEAALEADGMKDGLFDLEEQAGILAGSMDELTTRTLYNAAAANLSADAQIELAREMGLLNDESYAALSQVQYWNQQLADGKITVDEYTEKVAGLNEELRLMENPPPVIIDVEIDDEAWRNFKYEVTHFKGLIPVGAGGCA